MATHLSKKRSFESFESDQPNVHRPNKKKHKKKRQNDSDFFKIHYKSPPKFDLFSSHCVEFKNILHFVEEHHLSALVRNELSEWYKSKKNKKSANSVAMNGEFDIHLFHNRHNSALCGFAYVHFCSKSDASFIAQQSKQRKLKYQNKAISVEWKQREQDRDSYSAIFQTDDEQKGKTKMVKLSNLHWKTTLLHLHKMFVSVSADFEPHFLRILEDKNGFPKGQALALLADANCASMAVEKLSNCELLGRELKIEHSSFAYDGPLFCKFNADTAELSGVSKKLLLSNLKQSVKRSDIVNFLRANAFENDCVDEVVTDIHLIHNLNKVCAGKCFLEFDNAQIAKKYVDALNMKQLCHRTVVAEFGHLRNEKAVENGQSLKGKTNRIFMSNLVWNCTEKDVRRLIGSKAKIKNVYFNVTRNGFPTGSAFVTFESFECAARAVNKSNGKKLKNRVVRMDFAETEFK